MKRSKFVRPLIGVVCVGVIILVVGIALVLDSQSPNPIFGIFDFDSEEDEEEKEESWYILSEGKEAEEEEEEQEQDASEEDSAEQTVAPPQDLPSSVVIPTEKDPETGESMGLNFPCTISEYKIDIIKFASFDGMYVEDGTQANVQDVAMMMVENNGDFPIEYTQICVEYEEETLLFDITALPVGERMVVQEKNGKSIPEGTAEAANALVVQRAQMDMSEEKVSVTDNGNNTLTIQNLTDKQIPTVRVFYKYYMPDEDIFIGGVSFTVRVTRLAANGSITIQPAHYTSQTSRVVMVLTYDAEV